MTRPSLMVLAGVAVVVLTAGTLRAQTLPGADPTVILDELGRATPIRRPQAFRLFGNQDLAFAGMHGLGDNWGYVSNVGPCETGIFAQRCLRGASGNRFLIFELGLLAGVPRGDWLRNSIRAPSLLNARGGGWSQLRNDLVFTTKMEIGPKDGTLGSLFSGVTATTDGTCRDNSQSNNGVLSTNLQLLAGSDCPATWPGGVWMGDRPISPSSWLRLFRQQGAAFTFDFHRVPADLKRQDRFLGTNFSTYGTASDHHAGILASYGSVIPGGVGDPTNEGWPLGLDFEFQSYNFALGSTASVNYWQMLVINNSSQVYGTGLDYDSLYLGLTQGPNFGCCGPAEYFEPGRGAAILVGNGINVNCNGALVPTGVTGCGRPAGGALQVIGGIAVIFLRSPIGDLRNKLFTRPGSPFYMPGHPLAGDTITFNHAHACGFSACSNNTVRFSDKRGFGMLSSTESNVLDGRTPGSLAASEYWLSFRSRAFPTQDGRMNKWVPPGNWDWNHDGILDTLSLESCGGATGSPFVTMANGCIATYADTMPGKQNNRTGNVGGSVSVGPIRLAAGDTTTFLFAFIVERDSINLESAIDAAMESYLSMFLAPDSPPVTDIVSSEVDAAGDRRVVSLFFSDAPERWQDPFLLDFASKLDSAAAGTEMARLRTLNPTLAGQIRARAADNLQEIDVFKSCDGGGTFTAGTGCTPAPAVDLAGKRIGFGWQAYRILRRDAFPGQDIPNILTDSNVTGGRSYLYVMLSASRGAEFLVRDSVDTDGDGIFDAIGGRNLTLEQPMTSTSFIAPSEPNVVSVYVPFSRQSGALGARMDLRTSAGGATVPFGVLFGGGVVAGSYRAAFGNNIRVIEVHDPVITDSVRTSTVRLEDSVTAYDPATGTGFPAAYDVVTGVSTAPRGVPIAARSVCTAVATPSSDCVTTRSGDTTFYAFNTDGTLGFVLLNGGGTPLFVSTTLTGVAATPAGLFTSPDFPGFVVLADNRNAKALAAESTFQDGVLIPQANVDSFRVQWRGLAQQVSGQGNYHVQWTGDPFGVRRGFTIDFGDARMTSAALADSLAARIATPAPTDPGLALMVGLSPTRIRPARLPFTITNLSTGRPVTVVVFNRARDSIVLGDGADTVRVAVPANEWIPGDQMSFIEDVEEDSLGPGTLFVVLGADGRPLRVLRPRRTFGTAILGCNQPRESCNPVAPGTRGADSAAGTAYLPLTAGTVTTFNYLVGFNRYSDYTFTITAPLTGTGITGVSRAQLDSIRVVPNPFQLYSTFQTDAAEARVVFTHLPPRGVLRIYTVAGQFVQQLSWTEADLDAAGDLHYDLRTRGGRLLSTGLYVWVMNSDVGGRLRALGKFVVIR